MAQYTKQKLSGSTNGRQIGILTNDSPGTLIHTAVAGILDKDEVWLYAANLSSANVELTLELGGLENPFDRVKFSVPFKSGLYLVLPGFVFDGGVAIRAYASVPNVLVVGGWVNRITAT